MIKNQTQYKSKNPHLYTWMQTTQQFFPIEPHKYKINYGGTSKLDNQQEGNGDKNQKQKNKKKLYQKEEDQLCKLDKLAQVSKDYLKQQRKVYDQKKKQFSVTKYQDLALNSYYNQGGNDVEISNEDFFLNIFERKNFTLNKIFYDIAESLYRTKSHNIPSEQQQQQFSKTFTAQMNDAMQTPLIKRKSSNQFQNTTQSAFPQSSIKKDKRHPQDININGNSNTHKYLSQQQPKDFSIRSSQNSNKLLNKKSTIFRQKLSSIKELPYKQDLATRVATFIDRKQYIKDFNSTIDEDSVFHKNYFINRYPQPKVKVDLTNFTKKRCKNFELKIKQKCELINQNLQQ